MTVYSNDPKTPQLVLTLEGEIVTDVEPQPRRLSFGQVSKRDDATRELTLRVPEPEKIKITSVTLDDDRFELELDKGDPAGDATYEVRFKGSDSLGRIKAQIRVEFTGSEVKQLDIPLWGEIVGDLRYAKHLSFYKQKGAYRSRKVTFTSRTKQPVEVLDAKDLDGHLQVEIVKSKGDLAELEVSVGDAARKTGEPLKGTLEVKTTDRDEPEVKIQYGIYPANRLRSMKDRVRKPLGAVKVPPTASAR